MLRLIILELAIATSFLLSTEAQGTNPPTLSATNQPVHALVFEVKDEKGQVLPLFSPEAYRAEFRYLHRVFHKTDLTGPAVETDGWTYNISEAEWPFMGFCYFGYACANLAKYDPAIREEAFTEMRWLIEALQTPRL